jgi:K+-transporting ATPase KdpF subunit
VRVEDGTMLENAVGGLVAAGVLVYLLWALLEPERF